MAAKIYHDVGKRKTAVVRVWMKEGTGKIIVNDRPFEEYFPRETLRILIKKPLELTECDGKFDIYANAKGGGISAQADALKYGIARTLVKINEEYKPILKKEGLLTRDAREKERKKYGRPGARKRFQYSKR